MAVPVNENTNDNPNRTIYTIYMQNDISLSSLISKRQLKNIEIS